MNSPSYMYMTIALICSNVLKYPVPINKNINFLLLRQASRTDSIYTLRPAGPNYKRSVFCFGRKKSNADEAEAKHRTVVPNHTGKAES